MYLLDKIIGVSHSIIMKEEWRAVIDFPAYEISNTGKIRQRGISFTRPNPKNPSKNQTVKLKTKELSGTIKRFKGRTVCILVSLRKDGKTFHRRIHNLILTTFISQCPEGMEGCHNDGDPLNNKLSNLRWDTHKNNMADMLIHGTFSPPPHKFGEDHHNVTISNQDVEMLRKHAYKHGDIKKFAKKFKVNPITISRIKKGLSRQCTE